MSKDQVASIEPVTLLPLTSKSSSFNSNNISVNNNPNIQIELHTVSSSSLACSALIQGSLDGSSWLTLDSTSASITGDDDVLWSLAQIDALRYLRISVTRTAGSAIFSILYRGC